MVKLFREKTLNRISSPEELDGYIRVSRPSVWLILGALIALLVGFCVWGIFGRLDTTIQVDGQVISGVVTVVLSDEQASQLQEGMEIYLDKQEIGTITDISVNTEGKSYLQLSAGNLEDGSYELTILVESIAPMYFILN